MNQPTKKQKVLSKGTTVQQFQKHIVIYVYASNTFQLPDSSKEKQDCSNSIQLGSGRLTSPHTLPPSLDAFQYCNKLSRFWFFRPPRDLCAYIFAGLLLVLASCSNRQSAARHDQRISTSSHEISCVMI